METYQYILDQFIFNINYTYENETSATWSDPAEGGLEWDIISIKKENDDGIHEDFDINHLGEYYMNVDKIFDDITEKILKYIED